MADGLQLHTFILLTAYNFHSGFVGISIELLCKFIAAVIVKVSGVHIEDQLAVGLDY